MNFLKDVVLGLVGLIALNSMGYLAMNTSMGYDIIVYGCIIIVELLVLMWFVKWMRPRAEEETSSRGKRAVGGLMEECILIDQTMLNEVIIPTMNVDRRLADGSRQEDEVINKSQIYVKFFGQNVTNICA